MQWNSSLYDGKHSFVTRLGEGLIELLQPARGERVLDVGCGTGDLTARIAARGAEVVGLDSSPEMIESARGKHPDLTWVHSDIRQYRTYEPFDAVFSNAALHWVHEAEQAVEAMALALKPGGRFVVEFGGHGNVSQICSTLEDIVLKMTSQPVTAVNYFPSLSCYTTLLENHGIEVHYATLFDRPTRLNDGEEGLKNWLWMFRPSVLSRLSPTQQETLFTEIYQQLRPTLFRDGAWFADYRRLRIVGYRQPAPRRFVE